MLFNARIEAKENTSCIRMRSITMAKIICQKNKSRNSAEKDGKALHKLISNTVYGETVENFQNAFNVRLGSIKKLFKMNIETKLYVPKILNEHLFPKVKLH